MDPLLKLPFASLPSSLKTSFGFLEPYAIFYFGMTTQVVGRDKKTLVTFATKDSLYFAKKDSGILARRVVFSVIRAIYTNVLDPARMSPEQISAAKGQEPFIVLLLSVQERSDIILVGEYCVSFMPAFKKIWESAGFSGRITFEEDPKKWKRFTDLEHNYRVPQSSREGNPTLADMEKKDIATKKYGEQMLDQDFPDDEAKGSPRSAVRAVSFVDPNTGLQSPSMAVMQNPTVYHSLADLPYVTFAADEKTAFPTMSLPDRALLYCDRHYVFQPNPGPNGGGSGKVVSGTLADSFILLSTTHLYCAITEDRIMRCIPFNKFAKLWWVKDISGVQFTSAAIDKRNASSLLVQLLETEAGAITNASIASASAADKRREEHDLLIIFQNEEKMKVFSGVLEKIMSNLFAQLGVKFALAASLSLTAPLLTPYDEAFAATVAPVPTRSEEASRMKSRMKSMRVNEGQTSEVQKTLAAKRSMSLMGYLGMSGSPTKVSDKSAESALLTIAREDPLLLEEFPVTAELQERHPPLAITSIYWASRVVYHPSPLRKQAGQRSSELVVAFITRSQYVVANAGQNLRIFPVTAISAIRVKTIPRKSGEHNRQVIVLVGNSVEHDLCVELDREEEGRIMLTQLLIVMKKIDPYNVPSIRSFVDVESENFRFDANKFYKTPVIDLPLSFNTIAYRREVRQKAINAYMKHNPAKVDRVDAMMLEYEGKELQLLEKLRQKFGDDVDAADTDDLFGYRKRLMAFTDRYLPQETTENINRMLREYRGQEERMFELLVKRFGPEPKEPVITPAAKLAAMKREKSLKVMRTMTPKDRLIRIYQKYQPSKLGIVDTILDKYKNNEDVLFRKLEKLYGPEPEPPAELLNAPPPSQSKNVPASAPAANDVFKSVSYRDRVYAMCKRYTPGKLNTVDAVMEQFKGKEEDLIKGLVKKYGPEPIPCIPATRERLAAFFANHLPDRMSDDKLDAMLAAFRGTEAELYESLEKRYGKTGPYTPSGGVAPSPAADIKKKPKVNTGQVLASSDDDDDDTTAAGGPPLGTFDIYNRDGALSAGDSDRIRAIMTDKPTNGDKRSKGAESQLEATILQSIDMMTELPYVDVPVPVQHLFPSFARAAIVVFDRVLHWEPGTPPALKYLYVTTSHIYIAKSEQQVDRCVSIRDLKHVYLTTKREDVDSQCGVLLKLHPREHDCFFSMESDFEAKRFVWVIMELQHKYHLDYRCPITPVASLLEVGVNAQCKRPERFEVQVTPVTKRRRGLNVVNRRSEAMNNLFSKLHEAVIERTDAMEADALLDSQEAALLSKPSRGLIELSSKDKKVFGLGGAARAMVLPGREHSHAAAAAAAQNENESSSPQREVGASDYQKAMMLGQRSTNRNADGTLSVAFSHNAIDSDASPTGRARLHFDEGDGAAVLEQDIQRRHLNPIQREQFYMHSHTGFFGTSISGRNAAAFSAEDIRDSGGNNNNNSTTMDQISPQQNDLRDGELLFTTVDDPSFVPRADPSTSVNPMSTEDSLLQQGVLGVSDFYKASPLDAMGNVDTRRPYKAATGLLSPSVPKSTLTIRQHGATTPSNLNVAMPSIIRASASHATGTGVEASAATSWANAAVAPPPEVQRRLLGVDGSMFASPIQLQLNESSRSFMTPKAPRSSSSLNPAPGSTEYRRFLLDKAL